MTKPLLDKVRERLVAGGFSLRLECQELYSLSDKSTCLVGIGFDIQGGTGIYISNRSSGEVTYLRKIDGTLDKLDAAMEALRIAEMFESKVREAYPVGGEFFHDFMGRFPEYCFLIDEDPVYQTSVCYYAKDCRPDFFGASKPWEVCKTQPDSNWQYVGKGVTLESAQSELARVLESCDQ